MLNGPTGFKFVLIYYTFLRNKKLKTVIKYVFNNNLHPFQQYSLSQIV